MDNQTICGFVNSKDVGSYLAEINYQFSPAEAAWIVAQCRRLTLEARHAAWQDIMDTTPDCALESGQWPSADVRLHDVLRRVIEMDRNNLSVFYSGDENAVYQYTIDCLNCEQLDDYDDSPLFSQYEKCLAAVKEDIGKYGNEDIWFITIRKNYIDDPKRNLEMCLNKDCAVTSIRGAHGELDRNGMDLQTVFDDLWFSIPAPFKKGDIVWQMDRIVEAGPIVVDGITPDDYAATGHKGCDSSDMDVWGYFQNDRGELYHEVTHNYMDFEFFPEEMLVGKRRVLKALSNYLKGKIEIELFALAYRRILLEEELKDSMPNWFLEEGLRLAGIIE